MQANMCIAVSWTIKTNSFIDTIGSADFGVTQLIIVSGPRRADPLKYIMK